MDQSTGAARGFPAANQYFPNKDALVTALIQENQTNLIRKAQRVVNQTQGMTLEQRLQAVAALAIEQQFGDPVLAAALDHEEKRLPLQALLRETDAALLEAGLALFRPVLPTITPAEVADLFVITKALVEADGDLRAPTADLQTRIVRATWGYLQAGGGNTSKPLSWSATQPGDRTRPNSVG